MEQQLVVFELAGEHFGVDIGAVESIIKMQPVTRMPHTPDFIEGIINLRGTVLPVIDLRKRLSMYGGAEVEGKGLDQRRIIVVSVDHRMVGMIVDSVEEVLKVMEESVAPPPPMVTSINTAFITGIIKVGERLVIRLELQRVLSNQEVSEMASI